MAVFFPQCALHCCIYNTSEIWLSHDTLCFAKSNRITLSFIISVFSCHCNIKHADLHSMRHTIRVSNMRPVQGLLIHGFGILLNFPRFFSILFVSVPLHIRINKCNKQNQDTSDKTIITIVLLIYIDKYKPNQEGYR